MINTADNAIPNLSMSVYYVIPLTVVTPGLQPCAYYHGTGTSLTAVERGSHGKFVLSGVNDDADLPVYICVVHLTNPGAYTLNPPLPPAAIDTTVQLYSGVASAETDTSLAETFLANSGRLALPNVVFPVSRNHTRGLILLFQEIAPSGNGPTAYRKLRASLDPEIKGSDGGSRPS